VCVFPPPSSDAAPGARREPAGPGGGGCQPCAFHARRGQGWGQTVRAERGGGHDGCVVLRGEVVVVGVVVAAEPVAAAEQRLEVVG